MLTLLKLLVHFLEERIKKECIQSDVTVNFLASCQSDVIDSVQRRPVFKKRLL